MAAESTVGIRLLMIGKDAMLAGYRELQVAQEQYNAAVKEGTVASALSVGGYRGQMAGLRRLGDTMSVYQDQLLRVEAANARMTNLGRTAFLALGAATAVWGYESIKWAKDYQTQLLLLHTQAGLTVKQMNAVGVAAKANSAAFGYNATTYVQAAYHAASVGFRGADITNITEAGLKEARISGADPETTVNSLVSVMRAYNQTGKDATHTQALLNAAVGQGNMRYSEFNAALHSGIAATAHLYGVKLPSWLAALSYMTDQGVPAAQAGTRLRMGLSLLGAPSAQSQKFLNTLLGSQVGGTRSSVQSQLQAMGLSTTQLTSAMERTGSIQGALRVMEHAFRQYDIPPDMQRAFIGRAFGGGRVGSAIMALVNNPALLDLKQQRIQGAADPKQWNADFTASMKIMSAQTQRLSSELHNLGIEFGSKLLPVVTEAVKLFTDLLVFLDHHKFVLLGFAAVIGAVVVPAIGVYLYGAFQKWGGGIKVVVDWYARLLRGQSAQDAAMERTKKIIWDLTGATTKLSAADAELALAQARVNATSGFGAGMAWDPRLNAGKGGYRDLRTGRTVSGAGGMADVMGYGGGYGGPTPTVPMTGPLAGISRDEALIRDGAKTTGILQRMGMLGRSVFGKALGAAGLAYTGYMVASMIPGNEGTTVKAGSPHMHQAESVLKAMAVGAGWGAAIGNIIPIPGVGAGVGALVGAAAGAGYAERTHLHHYADVARHDVAAAGHSVWHGVTSAWDDIFGGSPTPRAPTTPVRPHLVAHVYLDGKELKRSMVKQVQIAAAQQ